MIRNYKQNIDIRNPRQTSITKLKQGDILTNVLEIELLSSGIPFDVEDKRVTAVFLTPDDKIVYQRWDDVILPLTREGNKVSMVLDDKVLALAGIVALEIIVEDENFNKLFSTPKLFLEVEGSIDVTKALKESSEFPIVKRLILDVEQLIRHIHTDPSFIGPRGYDGPRGNPGMRGPQGTEGKASTVEGPIGPIGPIGKEGLQGPKGSKGEPSTAVGPRGQTGPRGNPGTPGRDGIIGRDGKDGPKGPKGDKGDGIKYSDLTPEEIANIKGVPGDTGPAGPKGEPGKDSTVAGPTGPTGAVGAPGLNGKTGPAGTPGKDGKDGPQGSKGLTGAPGPQGEMGLPGSDGKDGSDATVTPEAVIQAIGYTPADASLIGDIETILDSIIGGI